MSSENRRRLILDSNRRELKKGDLVKFPRGIYSHWGIYDGFGYVIHVTGPSNSRNFSGVVSGSSTSENYGADVIIKKREAKHCY